MHTCGNCGSDVADGARFCPACGAPQMGSCRACGRELPIDARFCPACGTPTDAAAAEDEVPTRSAERKLVTVLFADVTGSTALGERLDPEPLRDVLDAYFSAMREAIEEEGGTVEKFIGDAVMAVFGVPLAHEDDPARALRAARRMLARLTDVNVGLEATHGLSLQIRIGVNTGEVLASPEAEPGEPMVTGDVVNTAARLQSAAEPGTVLVADRTARAARGFAFGEPSSLSLRGKQADVVARRLLGPRDGGDGERSEIGAPMVGRDREVRLLSTVFERVADERRPHLVTIYGEPGVGKSRLTREFVELIAGRRDEPQILTGRCLPYGSGVTYWPLAEILKERAGIRDPDGPDEVLARLDALRAEGVEPVDASKLRSAFAATLGLDDPRRPTASLEPKQVRREIHDAWRWLLNALGARRPVVVVIEDIHWADDALLDLIDELTDRLDAPALFVCPARPELTERRPTWGGGRRQASSIVLEPLDETAADRLVTLLLDIDELPAPVRRRILARAEGNPFFLEEIVRHLIDRGRIERIDGRWRASSDVGGVDIPDTVQGVLAARIDLLDPTDKRVLQLGAVVGRVFWPGSVRAQLNGDGDALDAALERLRSRDLVLARSATTVTGEREYIFKHILTRDVAYETLPRRDRASAHRTVATWIEGMARERVGEFTELLAYHYEQAYESERASPRADAGALTELRRRAFEAILAAAEGARRRFAVRRAYELLERALAIADEPLERARALECRGHAALTDYRGDDAWTSFREAVDLRLEHAPDDRASIAYAAARAVESPMRWPGSMREWPDDEVVMRYLRIGFDHAGTEPNETRVRLLAARAFIPFGLVTSRSHAGDREAHDRAVADGLEAADLALEIGRPDLASAALDGATSAAVDLGLYGDTRGPVERRLALADAVDDPWERGDIYAMATWTYVMLGDARTALRWAEAGANLVDEQGAEGVSLHSFAWGAFAQFELGAWDDALDWAARCRARLGDRVETPPYFTAHAFCSAAMIHRLRDEPAELEALRPTLTSLVGGGPVHHFQGAARAWMAWLAIRDGRLDEAERFLEETRTAATDTPRAFTTRVEAEFIAAAGRWDDVPAFLNDARAYAHDAGLLALPLHLDRLEARASAAAGEPERACRSFASAARGFAELEQRWEAARCDLELAETSHDGDPAAARQAVERAIVVFRDLRSVNELRRAETLAGTPT